MDLLNFNNINFQQISTLDLFTRFTLSLGLSLITGFVFSKSRHLINKDHNMILTGTGLSLIITMILTVLSENLFYALGLFAALSIIRFRTPIKNSIDSMNLFLCIGIGIAVGAGALKIALFGTLFILAVLYLFFFYFSSIKSAPLFLKIYSDKDVNLKEIENILKKHCNNYTHSQIIRSSNGSTESLFHLNPKKETGVDSTSKEISEIQGVNEVVIFPSIVESNLL